MIELYSPIEIDAPVEVVWDIMADLPAYPEWNPFIHEIAGPLETGAHLREKVYFFNNVYLPVGLIAKRILPLTEMELWRSGPAFLNVVYFGAHIFSFEPLPGGRTRFLHRYLSLGFVSWLVQAHLNKGVKQVQVKMNEALKQRAEARVRSQPAKSTA